MGLDTAATASAKVFISFRKRSDYWVVLAGFGEGVDGTQCMESGELIEAG